MNTPSIRRIDVLTGVVAIVLFVPCEAKCAGNVYVSMLGSDLSLDPGNPATPLLTLREAIERANDRDTINVGAGVFREPSLTISFPLTILGDGLGDTIIENAGGASAGSVISIDRLPGANSLRVDLTGLTLRGGSAQRGGGLANNGGNVVLRDLGITGNSIIGGGTGGAGIWNSATGTLNIQRSVIENNICGAGAPGGGILNSGGTITITKSTISNNQAGGGGAAIPNHNGRPGGGIANAAGTITIENTTISGNAAGDGAQVGSNAGGGGNGGGIWNGGSMSLLNSTISGNRAGNAGTPGPLAGPGGSGGAIDSTASAGIVRVRHCTVTNNQAGSSTGGDGYGGGAHNNSGTNTITIHNSIFWNNTIGPTGGGPDLAGSIGSEGFNVIGDDGFFNIGGANDLNGVNPLLGPLADNGGPNLTHSFPANSPVVDAADPNPANGITTDQRLAPRPAAGDSDIGAFERVNAPLSPDSDGDGLSDIDESPTGRDTNPRDADTDDDGMPDGWEVENGLNPRVDDADANSDGDLYTNRDEFLLGIDPRVFDGIEITVTAEPPKVVVDDPSPDRSFRLQRYDRAAANFVPISEWKTFDPANPEPGGDGFLDPAAAADFVLWRVEVSPNVPPPP